MTTPADDGKVYVYAAGLAHASVCAPAGMTRDEIAVAVSIDHPTGISPIWVVSDEPEFAGGGPNPGPCEKDPGRLHYLLDC